MLARHAKFSVVSHLLAHATTNSPNVKLYDYSWSALSFAETLIGIGTYANNISLPQSWVCNLRFLFFCLFLLILNILSFESSIFYFCDTQA